MSDRHSRREHTGSGLGLLLPAMVLASGLGYVVQVVVPFIAGTKDYVEFTAFWSALFFGVAVLSGIQQEVSRAVRNEPPTSGTGVLKRYTLSIVACCTLVGVVGGLALSSVVATPQVVVVVGALTIGLVGFAFLAVFAGAQFGTGSWIGAASAAVADPLVRALLVGAIAVAFFISAVRPSIDMLLFAAAAPFALAAGALILLYKPQRRGAISVDVGLRRMVRNTGYTVAAAAAMGFITAGLPLLVSIMGRRESAGLVAGTLLVVTLARAPLVSPMLALQSYLTVRFRGDPAAIPRRVALLCLVLIVAAGVLAAGGALVLGPLVGAFLPTYMLPNSATIVAIIGSAGFVACQFVTAPALLARGQHRMYTAGWVASAIVLVSLVLLPISFEILLMLAMLVPPLVGLGVHAVGLRRFPA